MEFPVTIELGEHGGTFRARKLEDLASFAQAELDAWSWFGNVITSIPNNQGNLESMIEAWRRHVQSINNIRAYANEGNADAAFSVFRGYFLEGAPLPISYTPQAKAIFGARDQVSSNAAVGAFAVLGGHRFDGGDSHQVSGVIMGHEFLAGTGSSARRSVQDGMASLLARLNMQQKRAEDTADQLERRIQRIELRRTSQFKRLMSAGQVARHEFSSEIDATIGRISSASSDAIRSIEKTEAVYMEHMALQGPVTYWRNKATEHRRAATIAGTIGIVFAFLLVAYAYLSGVSTLLELVKETVKDTKQWQMSYVVLTIVAFLLTIAFWIGRLISRTYVSQSHLALDADERATMVQTYLALANENKISEAERILVLTSLFRASADGLVRDDGAPDLTLSGFASRFAAGGQR